MQDDMKMCCHPGCENDLEEVAFWRGFIVWWVREKDAPVPRRAWEALARAEGKRGGWADEAVECPSFPPPGPGRDPH